MTFGSASPGPLVERAIADGFWPPTSPQRIQIDHKTVQDSRPAPELASACPKLLLQWGPDIWLQVNRKHDDVFLHRSEWNVTPEGTLALLRTWPFEACTTTALHPTWWPGYRAIHGWAFLVKGAGHRLVSPRIRDRGPWRTLRDDEHDVTMFQFHDLEADEATALEQARSGHALLEPAWLGGHYMSQEWVFRGALSCYQPSFYDPATRTSVVLVQDREVTPAEMGVAAGTRVHQVFAQPVDQVAFVFMDEVTGRRQLPALWAYGLEVRVMTAEGERRLDLDYQPPPLPGPPEWVRRLDGAAAGR